MSALVWFFVQSVAAFVVALVLVEAGVRLLDRWHERREQKRGDHYV